MSKTTFQILLVIGIIGTGNVLYAQSDQRPITFPDVEGYQTLVCDFHQHTVFSDGNVWPTIRVQEAMRDGLDAVSMTDHLEYQPHEKDIPHPDRNRSFQIAREAAKSQDLIVVNGAEITRDMPPGHSNAIFLQDVNKLLVKKPIDAFRAAREQGAFTFWNHPHWTAQYKDGIARLDPLHLQLINEGLLNGIEVVNDVTYSDEALQIALDHNLTMMGTSDIHGLIDWQYEVPNGGHRPVTLVFATEKKEGAIKEALESRRTVVWFKNTLIGRPEYLVPLITASMEIESAEYLNKTTVLEVVISNHSDAEYLLENHSAYTFHANAQIVRIQPNTTTKLWVKTIYKKDDVELQFKVLNGITAPKTYADLTLNIDVQ